MSAFFTQKLHRNVKKKKLENNSFQRPVRRAEIVYNQDFTVSIVLQQL